MGLFKKEDPLAKLTRESNYKVLWNPVTGTQYKILMYPYLMSKKSNEDVTVLELNPSNYSPEFKAFESNFLSQYNQLFQQGRETPRSGGGGDEFSLSLWPNFTISKDSHPFRVLQDSDYQDRNGDTQAEHFDFKEFGMFVYFDNSEPLDLKILKSQGSGCSFEEFVKFDFKPESDLFFVLWSMSAKDLNLKSSLIVRVKFVAGESEFRKVLITFPNKSPAFEISRFLERAGLK